MNEIADSSLWATTCRPLPGLGAMLRSLLPEGCEDLPWATFCRPLRGLVSNVACAAFQGLLLFFS